MWWYGWKCPGNEEARNVQINYYCPVSSSSQPSALRSLRLAGQLTLSFMTGKSETPSNYTHIPWYRLGNYSLGRPTSFWLIDRKREVPLKPHFFYKREICCTSFVALNPEPNNVYHIPGKGSHVPQISILTFIQFWTFTLLAFWIHLYW